MPHAEPEGFWDDRTNRRQFIDAFAAKKRFDPLLPNEWRDKLPKFRAYGVIP